MPIQLSDLQKIGLGLTIFGVGFIFLGMIFLFDKGLLAVGNILFLGGLCMIIGLERTCRFFFQSFKIKGTALFFGGILLVLIGWPLTGIIIEFYGFFLLFGGFLPIAINFLRRLPIIGSILLLPGLRQITDKLSESRSMQRKIDGLLIRKQSGSASSSNNSSQSVISEKTVPIKAPVPAVLKVRTRKSMLTDYTASYTENNFITAVRAMHEYSLKPSDLETLKQYKTRSPYSEVVETGEMLTVYRRSDVEKRAYEVWGSPEMLNKEKAKRAKARQQEYEAIFSLKKSLKEYQKRLLMLENASFDNQKSATNTILATGGGKVVIAAVLINATNAVVKTIGWLFTGSASLFSEAVHSIADTCNQLILTFGLYQSIKKPNPEHPYGYSNMTYISSLISGVGIFCFGTGLAWYHGVLVLLHPQEMESVFWVSKFID
ncbi:unnamed protein product [Rotaria sp. Silwood2]|nr:unnamed protein product [Rotaria sp. Silwood2]CAF3162917.1 unnamed protein product [Rotaria sp. Silwood2]CAF4023174.1 unnamed protein product [Rotaria sp. Silwood2]